jgi:RimJ/RimL family protein N-acetyltransferase
MNIVARGDRTLLRAFEDELSNQEIDRIYRWSCDVDILRWSGGSPLTMSLREFSERLRRESASPPIDRRMFFILTLDRELIGRIGCFGLDLNEREGELGVVIGEESRWNQGLGRDAIVTMLNHLFATTLLNRVRLYTFPENLRAQKCFAACGFRSLGMVRRFSSDLGEFTGIEMEITRAEFLNRARTSVTQIPLPQGPS